MTRARLAACRHAGVAVLALLFVPALAHGHAMKVHSWFEGDTLMTLVRYSDNEYVSDATVTIRSVTGEVLVEGGRTGPEGMHAWVPREGQIGLHGAVEVAAEDGMGHAAKTRVAVAGSNAGAAGAGLEGIVRAVVQEELNPLKREVALLRDTGPGVTEIAGGIGYIVGLAGLVAWLRRPRTARA